MLITGAGGDIGGSLTRALRNHYEVLGLDLESKADGKSIIAVDLTDDASVRDALAEVRQRLPRS